jgi:hypothetical protein
MDTVTVTEREDMEADHAKTNHERDLTKTAMAMRKTLASYEGTRYNRTAGGFTVLWWVFRIFKSSFPFSPGVRGSFTMHFSPLLAKGSIAIDYSTCTQLDRT